MSALDLGALETIQFRAEALARCVREAPGVILVSTLLETPLAGPRPAPARVSLDSLQALSADLTNLQQSLRDHSEAAHLIPPTPTKVEELKAHADAAERAELTRRAAAQAQVPVIVPQLSEESIVARLGREARNSALLTEVLCKRVERAVASNVDDRRLLEEMSRLEGRLLALQQRPQMPALPVGDAHFALEQQLATLEEDRTRAASARGEALSLLQEFLSQRYVQTLPAPREGNVPPLSSLRALVEALLQLPKDDYLQLLKDQYWQPHVNALHTAQLIEAHPLDPTRIRLLDFRS